MSKVTLAARSKMVQFLPDYPNSHVDMEGALPILWSGEEPVLWLAYVEERAHDIKSLFFVESARIGRKELCLGLAEGRDEKNDQCETSETILSFVREFIEKRDVTPTRMADPEAIEAWLAVGRVRIGSRPRVSNAVKSKALGSKPATEGFDFDAMLLAVKAHIAEHGYAGTGLMPDGSPGIAQRISWAYGQTAIENPAMTVEIATKAVYESIEAELCGLRARARAMDACRVVLSNDEWSDAVKVVKMTEALRDAAS